jgi:hypothetical protein
MDALRVAAPLARLLLALSETGCEGEVSLRQQGRTAKLSIAGGRATAVSGVEGVPLGDTLLALGALDVHVQRGLLSERTHGPIGASLVALGATSSAAVACALEVQLADGIERLLRWPASQVTLRRGPLRRNAEDAVTVDVAGAVWSALLVLAGDLTDAQRAQLCGTEALSLTGAGKRRVRGLARAIEAGELGAAFRRRAFTCRGVAGCAAPSTPALTGVTSLFAGPLDHALSAALGAHPEPHLHALRAVLRALGVAIARPAHEDSYALLLRKRRQLSRNASASALLDLPELASAEHARRALRRLAQKLHPDRFQAGDARLHAVSSEVMGALLHAEFSLRARRGGRGGVRA